MNLTHVMTRTFAPVEQSYDWRDAALYALSLGMGDNPLDEDELFYVFEGRPQQAVPSPWAGHHLARRPGHGHHVDADLARRAALHLASTAAPRQPPFCTIPARRRRQWRLRFAVRAFTSASSRRTADRELRLQHGQASRIVLPAREPRLYAHSCGSRRRAERGLRTTNLTRSQHDGTGLPRDFETLRAAAAGTAYVHVGALRPTGVPRRHD
jgi:hypothetical protein